MRGGSFSHGCTAALCAVAMASPLEVRAQDPVSQPVAEADAGRPAPAVDPPAADPPAASEACVPDCREGFVCHQGACISACNPPCPDEQVCNGSGQCVAPSSVAEGPATDPVATVAVTGTCVSDHQCRHPRRCDAGVCRVTEDYLAQLNAEARTRTIAGAVIMGVGGLIMLSSAIAFASGNKRARQGLSDDDAYVAGYSLLGVGALVVIGGSIPLGLGRNKKRRWRVLSKPETTPLGE